MPLLKVIGPHWNAQIVECYHFVLNVYAFAHLGSRANQDADSSGINKVIELLPCLVPVIVSDIRNLVSRNAALYKLGNQVSVEVERIPFCVPAPHAGIKEYDLRAFVFL